MNFNYHIDNTFSLKKKNIDQILKSLKKTFVVVKYSHCSSIAFEI